VSGARGDEEGALEEAGFDRVDLRYGVPLPVVENGVAIRRPLRRLVQAAAFVPGAGGLEELRRQVTLRYQAEAGGCD
jgi:hypothetical protein